MNLRRIVKYYLLVFGVPFSMCLALRFVLLSVAIAQLCGTVGVISSYPEESEIDYSGPSFTSSSSTKRMKAIVAEEGKCKLVERETPRPQDGEVSLHFTVLLKVAKWRVSYGVRAGAGTSALHRH
eukprot:gb/GECG01012264.1/.p1 GENE.gb/GECG01012264.1/~~gb/GECG01012264.1/.p1  ORF type:complete len:125 (+),score=9.19 gb/GECG01012264.1/:1-375(+)